MKRCGHCREAKPRSEFHGNRRQPDGLQGYCKSCQVIVARHYRSLDPERYRERERRSRASNVERARASYRKWDLRTKYGITPDEYDDMLDAQGGVCAICGSPPLSERAHHRRLAVDHDHANGMVRRLLCGTCNRAVGLFDDNPEWLREAARYLEETRQWA